MAPDLFVAPVNVSLMTGMRAFWTDRSFVTPVIEFRRSAKPVKNELRAADTGAG